MLDYAHEEGYDEGYQKAVSKYEELLQQTIKRAEEEKRRAEEQEKLLIEEKRRAEEEKNKIIHAIKNLKENGFSDDQIESLLSIKISDYL